MHASASGIRQHQAASRRRAAELPHNEGRCSAGSARPRGWPRPTPIRRAAIAVAAGVLMQAAAEDRGQSGRQPVGCARGDAAVMFGSRPRRPIRRYALRGTSPVCARSLWRAAPASVAIVLEARISPMELELARLATGCWLLAGGCSLAVVPHPRRPAHCAPPRRHGTVLMSLVVSWCLRAWQNASPGASGVVHAHASHERRAQTWATSSPAAGGQSRASDQREKAGDATPSALLAQARPASKH